MGSKGERGESSMEKMGHEGPMTIWMLGHSTRSFDDFCALLRGAVPRSRVLRPVVLTTRPVLWSGPLGPVLRSGTLVPIQLLRSTTAG